MCPNNAKMLTRNLLGFNDLLDNDEVMEKNRECSNSQNSMEFMIPKINYYINVKMTTLAFMGLMLDVEFTKGFTSFILSVFGVTADVIRKLFDVEKCVLLLVKVEDVLAKEDGYVLIGYMIASLAVHIIVYHEIGHHKQGHIVN